MSEASYHSSGHRINMKEQSLLREMSEVSDQSADHHNKNYSVGMPKHWAGIVTSPKGAWSHVQLPQSAVYHVRSSPHRAIDSREKNPFKSFRVPDDSRTTTTNYRQEEDGPKPYTSYFSQAASSFTQDDMASLRSDDIGEVKCDMCQAKALKTCLICHESYCERDARPHYIESALDGHKLIDTYNWAKGNHYPHYKNCIDPSCRNNHIYPGRGGHGGHVGHCGHPGHGWNIRSFVDDQKSISHYDDEDQEPEEADTGVPPPGEIQFLSVEPHSVVLRWGCPEGLVGPKRFRVKWRSSNKTESYIVVKDFLRIEINNLELGQRYDFSVATEDRHGHLSRAVKKSVFTALPVPQHLTKEHAESKAFSLKWTKGKDMDGIPHQYLITFTNPEREALAIYTEECYKVFTDLKPDTEYDVSVCTVLNGQYSEEVSTTVHTEPCLREVLSEIGLEDQYDNKCTLSSVMEINRNDASQNKVITDQSLPEAFLKRLLMLNADARSIRCVSTDVENSSINPLDLTTALFLCSDGFLQQDLSLKMSLCQFAVPLLLPNHETREITMMLWSMCEIIRSFRPSNLAFMNQSCEERIVLSDIPLVSFVRLGRTSLSKSETLNKLFSNAEQYNQTFTHRDMMYGDVPRRISDGLVEISWVLPCGKRSIDKYPEPLAVANLRGDLRAFDKQFSFLCQTSAALYIFCEESEEGYLKILEGKEVKANLTLISTAKGKTTLKTLKVKPRVNTTNVSQKKNPKTELIKVLQESVSKMLERCENKDSLENMADRARSCGILVDEDSDECHSAWKNLDRITQKVANSSEFKEKNLPYQGNIWKAISWLETESWRLRKAGNQNPEDYRESLKAKQRELKKKQLNLKISTVMSSFLHGLLTSEVQRYYFLKWLEIDLENMSRTKMSALQNQYKQVVQKSPEDKYKIAEIGRQVSVCSLRLEHFFRECGQLYECASSLPEYSRQRKNMEQLPALCAQMLLDGFPLELVDGDAANIPLKWITSVLTELHYMMQSNSKLKVIAIIGAENSGKSTLLNTAFGTRLAVGKATCTRGAFIQLLGVNNDAKGVLGCDCIMIIDTEGLKPHQAVQEDHSHELDREVASLAVALSDVVIVSISGEDSKEKDILEMVLHAFARVKDSGRKPVCHFVQSNVSMTDEQRKNKGKEWGKQLNEMIRNDVEMTKARVSRISDLMELHADICSWCIPPLWDRTPPMAPVSLDYSETASAVKKQLLRDLSGRQGRSDLKDFIRRVADVWKTL